MDYLDKILWSGSKRTAFWISSLGIALGLAILLLGIQAIIDIRDYNKPSQSTFLSINKRVNLLNTLGMQSDFQPEEIEEIRQIEGIKKIAAFSTNNFRLRASSKILGFYSEFFFESLPDGFLQDLPASFQWSEGDKTVPIIIPGEYIALYNFGFAPSQGLPQVSPQLIQRFSFDLELIGSNNRSNFSGKIVGLSDQVNTILVPDDFLSWANRYFAGSKKSRVSRLALLCEAEDQSLLKKLLEKEGYELNSNQFLDSQASLLVQLALGISIVIGLLILILSAFLAIQSINSFLTSSISEIRALFEIGHSPYMLLSFYRKHSNRILLFGLFGGLLVFIGVHIIIKKWLMTQGFQVGLYPHWIIFVFIILGGLLFRLNQNKRLEKQLRSLFP